LRPETWNSSSDARVLPGWRHTFVVELRSKGALGVVELGVVGLQLRELRSVGALGGRGWWHRWRLGPVSE
jgi:hypothetical protein